MRCIKTVLVAEDNIVLGDVLRFNLQRCGFDVVLARTGDDALRLISSQPFDVLVTDYEMPGLNGEELCSQVRDELKIDSIRIIMCSAKGLELDREAMKSRYRIEDILYKPFSIRDLTSLLEKLGTSSNTSDPLLSLSS
jgi:CheY-like chemotaxis protein